MSMRCRVNVYGVPCQCVRGAVSMCMWCRVNVYGVPCQCVRGAVSMCMGCLVVLNQAVLLGAWCQ